MRRRVSYCKCESKLRPSVDFVNQMIAHHQGAIASCKVLTDSAADGTITLDFTVETMCEGIVKAQTHEINNIMFPYLEKKGYPTPPKLCEAGPMFWDKTSNFETIDPVGTFQWYDALGGGIALVAFVMLGVFIAKAPRRETAPLH